MTADLGRNESIGTSGVRRRWVLIAAVVGMLVGLLGGIRGPEIASEAAAVMRGDIGNTRQQMADIAPSVPGVERWELNTVLANGLGTTAAGTMGNFWLKTGANSETEEAAVQFLAAWVVGVPLVADQRVEWCVIRSDGTRVPSDLPGSVCRTTV